MYLNPLTRWTSVDVAEIVSRTATTKYVKPRRCNTPSIRRFSNDTFPPVLKQRQISHNLTADIIVTKAELLHAIAHVNAHQL